MIQRDLTNIVPLIIRETIREMRTKGRGSGFGISKTQRRKWGYLSNYKTFTSPDGTKYTQKIYGHSGLVKRHH